MTFVKYSQTFDSPLELEILTMLVWDMHFRDNITSAAEA